VIFGIVKIYSGTAQFLDLKNKFDVLTTWGTLKKMLPLRISPRIVKIIITKMLKCYRATSSLKNHKKTHSFKGAAANIPNFIQAIDLRLGLETLHCRPRVTVRIRVRFRCD